VGLRAGLDAVVKIRSPFTEPAVTRSPVVTTLIELPRFSSLTLTRVEQVPVKFFEIWTAPTRFHLDRCPKVCEPERREQKTNPCHFYLLPVRKLDK
jgi:hypothetical protein